MNLLILENLTFKNILFSDSRSGSMGDLSLSFLLHSAGTDRPGI